MFKMNKKAIGIVIIIFGIYLVIGNTLGSLLFNYAGPVGFYVPISPLEYWSNWWNLYGLVTVLIAVAGLIIIILGIRVFIKNKNRTMINTESN